MQATELEALLSSFASHSQLHAHLEENEAEKAREAKQRDEDTQLRSAPEHAAARIRAHHDDVISGHERKARVHARRASYAQAGLLLRSPAETADVEYQKRHATLHSEMDKAGRIYPSDDADGPNCC